MPLFIAGIVALSQQQISLNMRSNNISNNKPACSSSPDVLHIKGSPQLDGVPALTFIQAELQLSGGLLCLQQT